MIQCLRNRLRDWLHEREIRRIGHELVAAMERDDNLTAGYLCQAHIKAIRARSPEQVIRMERRMGLHPRRAVKRHLMTAFLKGRVPSSLVTAIFRLLRLRSL